MSDTKRDSDEVPTAGGARASDRTGGQTGSRRAKADERKDRLAQAVRENLLSRKPPARARKQASDVPDANDLADPRYDGAPSDN